MQIEIMFIHIFFFRGSKGQRGEVWWSDAEITHRFQLHKDQQAPKGMCARLRVFMSTWERNRK